MEGRTFIGEDSGAEKSSGKKAGSRGTDRQCVRNRKGESHAATLGMQVT